MPKALILSDRRADEAATRADRERFGRMARALARGGIDAEHRFAGDEDEVRAALAECAPDLAFSAALLCAPGPRGRKNMHAIFEEAGLPYVGSDPAALELAIDKAALKRRWIAHRVRTPDFLSVEPDGRLDEAAASLLGFPCIVKPAREGNSRGIGEDSVVRDMAALRERVASAARRYGPVLVERFLGDDGGVREFTAALLGTTERGLVLPVEIILKAPKAVRLVTTEDKDEHRTEARPIADPELSERVAAFARRAFVAAGVRDYARCDILLADGELAAIEINGQPMVPDRWFEACCAGAGLGGDAYLCALFLAALARIEREGGAGRERPAIPDAMRDIIPPAAYEALGRREG